MNISGSLLEFLADMRKWFGRDFNPHLSEMKLSRLAGYIQGYLTARTQHGMPDALAEELLDWLRAKGEYPPEGWEAKLRRDFGNDEVKAIHKFLDLAAEFMRTKGLYPV